MWILKNIETEETYEIGDCEFVNDALHPFGRTSGFTKFHGHIRRIKNDMYIHRFLQLPDLKVDDIVEVFSMDNKWEKMHFASYCYDEIYVFVAGRSSHTNQFGSYKVQKEHWRIPEDK